MSKLDARSLRNDESKRSRDFSLAMDLRTQSERAQCACLGPKPRGRAHPSPDLTKLGRWPSCLRLARSQRRGEARADQATQISPRLFIFLSRVLAPAPGSAVLSSFSP
jgi:hypothetical protein